MIEMSRQQSAPVPKLTGHAKLKLLMDNTTSKGVIEDGTQLQSYIRCVRCRACFLFSQAFRRLGNVNSLVSYTGLYALHCHPGSGLASG